MVNDRLSAPRIVRFFDTENLSDGERTYLNFAAHRYEWLLSHVRELLTTQDDSGLCVLDIGPGFQTQLMRVIYPTATINSLGLRVDRRGPREHEQHWTFDLNDTVNGHFPDLGQYDLVIMGEVIEHLYTPPATVLREIARVMRPGASLIVQTPNAVALHKRLRMLVGKHPFGPLMESRDNPLHFREYTPAELVAAGKDAGLRLTNLHVANYFSRGTFPSRAYNAIARWLPAPFRAGISATFERPPRWTPH